MTGRGNSPRVLITGGTGFIGSRLALDCLERGWAVSVISRTRDAVELSGGVEAVRVDLRDEAWVRDVLTGRSFEYVVNCAGYIDHSPESGHGRSVFDAHFGGLLNLIGSLDRNRLRGFVQLGSSDEYGGNPAPQSETMRESPFSPYSLAKVASSHYIQMLNRTEGFPGVVLRLYLAFGPGQGTDRFLPQVIEGCLQNREFETSAGEQLRDFCHIEDITAGVLKALETPAAFGEVVNLGSGRPRSIRSVIETVVEIVGRGKPLYGALDYRAGENMELYPDISKAEALLGWSPRVGFEEGLERTIQSYRKRAG